MCCVHLYARQQDVPPRLHRADGCALCSVCICAGISHSLSLQPAAFRVSLCKAYKYNGAYLSPPRHPRLASVRPRTLILRCSLVVRESPLVNCRQQQHCVSHPRQPAGSRTTPAGTCCWQATAVTTTAPADIFQRRVPRVSTATATRHPPHYRHATAHRLCACVPARLPMFAVLTVHVPAE